MQVLITGANGFVGSYLARFLEAKKVKLKCAVRSADKVLNRFEYTVVSNILSVAQWKKALIGVDTVIHLIAKTHGVNETESHNYAQYKQINVAATQALCEAIKGSDVKRLIYLSSIKVNGEKTILAKPFNELSVCEPKDNYGKTKLEAENAIKKKLAKTDVNYVIIRPPIIYGEELKGNLLLLKNAINRGILLPFAKINNARSMISQANLCSFIYCCLSAPSSKLNQAFLVSNNKAVSTKDIINQIAKQCGRSPRLFYFPPLVLKVMLVFLGKNSLSEKLLDNLEIDNSFAKKQLNWMPDC